MKKYLILIIFLGLALRLWTLTLETSYWFDEILTLKISQQSWLDIIKLSFHDTCPPLIYFLVKLWPSRFLPLIFSILTLPVFYKLGQNLFKKISASSALIISLVFLALSSTQIYYSTELRMYSLFIFLTCLSYLYFWKIIDQQNKKINLIIYFLINLFLIYTHFFAWFIILAQIIYQYKRKKIYLANIINFLLFLPWLVFWLKTKLTADITQGWFFQSLSLTEWLSLWSNFIFLNKLPLILQILIFALIIFLLFNSLKNKKLKPEILFLFFWLLIPLFLGFISQLYILRYYLFITPPLYLLLALGLNNLKIKFKNIILIIIFLLLIINNFLVLPDFYTQARPWPKVLSALETPAEIIIIHSFPEQLLFAEYYSGQTPDQSFYPLSDDLNYLTRILKYDWRPLITPANVGRIDLQIEPYQAIAIFSNDQFNQSLLSKYLQKDWQIQSQEIIPPRFSLTTWKKKEE